MSAPLPCRPTGNRSCTGAAGRPAQAGRRVAPNTQLLAACLLGRHSATTAASPTPPHPSSCSECVRAGITMLSIGHRPALRQFHSRIVEFLGNGGATAQHTLRDSDADGLAEAVAAGSVLPLPPGQGHQHQP